MDGLPEERNYYIFTSESFGTDKPVAVTILPDEHVVRGTVGTKSVWTVRYLNREKGICTFNHTECGSHAGIPENEDGSAGHGRRLEEPQHWTLKKTDHGISVSREFNGVELFSHLDDDGKLTASPSSKGITSWAFIPLADDLPEPQDYYVITSESFGTDDPIAVTILPDEHVLRGTSGKKSVWTLKYVDREKGICTFNHTECGSHAGIHENEDGSAGHGRRFEEPQHWTLKKTDHGISVSREFNGVELFSHLDDDGKLTASPSSKGITSWVFQPVNSE